MTNGVNFSVGNETSNPTAAAQPQSSAGAKVTPPRKATHLRDLATSLARPLSRTDASEALNQAKKKFDELFATKANHSRGTFAIENFDLIAVDAAEQGLGLSSIVFSLLVDTGAGNAVIYHTMLIEGTNVCGAYNTVLPALQIENGNRRFEVPQTPGDIVNDYFIDRIANVVTNFYALDNLELVPAGTSVLPNEADMDNSSTVNALATCAVNAVATIGSETYNLQDVFSMSIFGDSSNVEVLIDNRGHAVMSASGAPIRSDIRVDVVGTVRNEGGNTRTPLTSLSGYLTLKYNPSEVRRNARSRRNEEDRNYQAVLEITAPDVTFNAITTELFMLSLASVNVLRANDTWRQGLLPNANYPERQVGALVLSDDKAPQHLDLLAANVTEDDVYRIIDDFVRDDLAVVIQIPQCDEMSWMNGVILASAGGDTNATGLIVKALDNLTDEAFSEEFDVDDMREAASRMFRLMDSRIPLGYYIDRNKNRVDLRTIDELYFLNLDSVDPEEAFELSQQWQELILQDNISVEQRCDEMLAMIEQVVGINNVYLKGWASQVIAMPAFLDSIAESIESTGVRLDRVSTDSSVGRRRRGSDVLNQYASDGAAAGRMFSSGRRERKTARRGYTSNRRYR